MDGPLYAYSEDRAATLFDFCVKTRSSLEDTYRLYHIREVKKV